MQTFEEIWKTGWTDVQLHDIVKKMEVCAIQIIEIKPSTIISNGTFSSADCASGSTRTSSGASSTMTNRAKTKGNDKRSLLKFKRLMVQ